MIGSLNLAKLDVCGYSYKFNLIHHFLVFNVKVVSHFVLSILDGQL